MLPKCVFASLSFLRSLFGTVCERKKKTKTNGWFINIYLPSIDKVLYKITRSRKPKLGHQMPQKTTLLSPTHITGCRISNVELQWWKNYSPPHTWNWKGCQAKHFMSTTNDLTAWTSQAHLPATFLGWGGGGGFLSTETKLSITLCKALIFPQHYQPLPPEYTCTHMHSNKYICITHKK